MKYTVLRVICAIVLCAPLLQKASAQEYRQITIDDFQGAPRPNSTGVIAYTDCVIEFKYKPIPENGFYRLNFNISMQMNKDKSWMYKNKITSRAMLAEILKHEQGHFNIAYMEKQELLKAVSQTVFHEDYAAQAQKIFDQIDAKYRQLNIDYDNDTDHMINCAQQISWDKYFIRQFEYMPMGEMDASN